MEFLLDNWALFVAGALAVLVWYLLSRPRGIPPGPRGLPFVGNLHQLSQNEPHIDFMKIGKQYGDVFSIYIGTKLVIVLNSYQAMKEAFVNMGSTFADRPKAVILKPENGGRIFSAQYNDEFLSEKKFALMALRFAGYGTKAAEDRMLSAIDDFSNILMEQNKKPEDLKRVLQKSTAKVICGILYNKQYSMEDPELEFLVKGVEDLLLDFTGEAALADAVPTWLAPLLFSRVLKSVGNKAQAIINSICIKRIEEHRANFDSDNPRDFVDYYLGAGEKGPMYSDLDLARLSFGFFVDAIDTTAHLINWNIFFLALYPEWQVQLHDQIEEVVGSSRAPAIADRSQLPKVEAFQQEVLRASHLFTLSLTHKPLQETTLHGYRIPKNASIIGNYYAVNYDPDIWPEPDQFQPQRHLDGDGKFIKTDKVWIFGQGRRMCMGEQLVKNETFMFIVRLLQHFSFEFPKDSLKPRLEDATGDIIRRPPPFKVCSIPL